jgi:hypothetical protein
MLDMKLQRGLHVLLWAILLSAALISCMPTPQELIPLASFTENYVEVSIYLARSFEGNYHLSATFTPPGGYHLYSKDIPVTGLNGLGRPTLLELTADSVLRAIGIAGISSGRRDLEPAGRTTPGKRLDGG